MRVIIAGSRHARLSLYHIPQAIKRSGFTVTEIITGGARGVDMYGYIYALNNKVPHEVFKPEWEKYGKKGGPIRNEQMARAADALILIWDGKSRGSADMLRRAEKHGLKIYQEIL